MTDFASFGRGGASFPLGTSSSYSLLRDADPAIFFALEYYAAVLETHLGDRLVEATAAAGAGQIASAVAEVMPCNPEPWLQDKHVKFPLLSLYRKGTTYRYIGSRKVSVQDMELAYVLPPMRASEAEQVLPILHAVEAVIDHCTEQGFDPSYTPSSPAGSAGEVVWSASRAGLVRVEVMGSTEGAYTPAADLYFPAIIIALQMQERADPLLSELETFAGADVIEDLVAEGTTYPIVLETRLLAAPVIESLDEDTGLKAGGDAVEITGSGFVVGRPYRVIFGGADADSVIATATTTLECLTPLVAAYPTLVVDVYVIDQDGQVSNTLTDAFTFTTP